MTGFGEAHRQEESLAVSVEVRTINSRYFKLTVRCGEGYGVLEPEIENVVRQQIRRGTVQVNLRIDRMAAPDDYQLNIAVLDQYRKQLDRLRAEWKLSDDVPLAAMLQLPGVVAEHPLKPSEALDEWPLIRKALEEAMQHLAAMRAREGQAMEDDLRGNCRAIAEQLDLVAQRTPLVVESYRARLIDRLTQLLAEQKVSLDPAALIREVSIYADRSDISEEIVRLRSHIDQFEATCALPESSGRKLDFLTQEMFREVNTIGSKSNDVEIARHVIEAKTAIERIREMIQNVE